MNALTAHELEERILDYVYDELSAEERAAFEAALPSAPEVAAEVAAMQKTRTTMSSLGPPPMAPGLIGGMDAVFAEAAAMAATMAAQQAPAAAQPRTSVSQPAEPSGFGAWLAKLGRSFGASLMTPAFGAMAAVLIVAGVAVVMSRSGKFPGEDRSAESQEIGAVAPVAVAEAPAASAPAFVSDSEFAPEAPVLDDRFAEARGAAGSTTASLDSAINALEDKPTESAPGDEAGAIVAAKAEFAGGIDAKAKNTKDDDLLRSRRDPAQAARDFDEKAAESATGELMWNGPQGAASGAGDGLMAKADVAADLDASGRKFAPAPTNQHEPPAVGHATDAPRPDDSVAQTATPNRASAKPSATPKGAPQAPVVAEEAERDDGDRRNEYASVAKPTTTAPSPSRDDNDGGGREQASVADSARPAPEPAKQAADKKPDTTQRVEALWATFKRQVEAGDTLAAQKTLAALETLGADAVRLKAARAQVADLERRLAAEKKAIPATRSTK